ncbi:MBL fold metallo-hydrolase [Shewanella sp. GXUN23E]|uniref:MBL fold metallo-hydrolase n=1 Tax=Shewanella sp. GXUN23E TaxID=3422498 RepID=UPI003D7F0F0E
MHTDNSQVTQRGTLLEYPLPIPAARARVQEIVPGVLWARMPMPMKLDHINVYLLEDTDGWYLVDTGLPNAATRQLWQELVETALGNKPLKGLICTHFHYDHAGLAPWLTAFYNIPLLMTFGEYFYMRSAGVRRDGPMIAQLTEFYRLGGVPPSEISAMLMAVDKDPFMGQVPMRFNRLIDGQRLAIGAGSWQVVTTAGHSPEHACLWCEEHKILIAGDQLLPEISSNVLVTDIEPQANPLKCWLASLQRLKALPADTLILPAHGPVFIGAHQRIDSLALHHRQQLDKLAQMLTDTGGVTLYQATMQLFTRSLGPIERMMAIGETAAHLNWLIDAGRVTKATDSDGVDQYYYKNNQ